MVMTDMSSSPVVMFVAFVVFLFCQYAIWVCSNLIAHHFSLTGKIYWCVVLVSFLILNEFCFGAYDFAFGDDEPIEKWETIWDDEL